MSGERKRYPLFGQYPRPYSDPLAPEFGSGADRRAYAAEFPDWCKPVHGREQPWFRIGAAVFWGSTGMSDGSCRAWDSEDKAVLVTSAPNWRLLKMRLAALHGLPATAVEVRPNLPIWVKS